MIEGQDKVKIVGTDYTMVVRTPEVELWQSITESVWRHIQEGRNLVWESSEGCNRVIVLNPARVLWVEPVPAMSSSSGRTPAASPCPKMCSVIRGLIFKAFGI